jgi:outer membrane protein OmpA-like peptidoglycan-associated protein
VAAFVLTRNDGAPDASPRRVTAADIPVIEIRAPRALLSTRNDQIEADPAVIHAPVIDTETGLPKPDVIKFTLEPDVLFDYRKSHLTRAGHRAVALAVARMRTYDAIAWVRVEGHTDSRGPAIANLRLSRDRIETVIRTLKRAQLPSQPRLISRAYGESRPVAPNIRPNGSDNPAGRELNRRVVIQFQAGTH